MSRSGVLLAACMLLALGACDGAPTTPAETLSEDAAEQLAVGALDAAEQDGAPLPSLERLVHATVEVIRADPAPYAHAIRALRAAHEQAAKAREAHEAGDTEDARRHRARSRALTLRAVVAVLGPGVAGEALAGVDHALARLGERLADKTLPPRLHNALDRARGLAARGHEALAQGNPHRALGTALAAADVIRSLSPAYQARRALQGATRAFRAAREAVGSTATESEADALRTAHRHLTAGHDAFVAKDFRNAVRHAAASAELSLAVLHARSGG